MRIRKLSKANITAVLALILAAAVIFSGCSSSGESHDSDSPGLSRGEHEREGDEGSGGAGDGGEESGTEFALDETFDMVRNGARLILVYDAQSNSFNGTVENTTGKTLKRVRVEVHLSNGIELGPTIPADLEPGETMSVKLSATSEPFDGWSAHPEVGGGEGNGEHGGEGSGEHGGEGSDEL